VDGRADLYALGLLLCEALGGALPPAGRPVTSWLRGRNPQVTAELANVLGRCLAADPGARYPDAATLADDLRRQLADPPRRGKGRRRGPLLAVLVGVGLALAHVGFQGHRGRAALDASRDHLERREYEAARDACRRGLDLAGGLPFQGDLTEALHTQLRRVDRAETAQELRRLVERLRELAVVDGPPAAGP
jgi:hypothetical protein